MLRHSRRAKIEATMRVLARIRGPTSVPLHKLATYCRRHEGAARWSLLRAEVPDVRLRPLFTGAQEDRVQRVLNRARRRSRELGVPFDKSMMQFVVVEVPPGADPQVVAHLAGCWPAVAYAYIEEEAGPPPERLQDSDPLRPRQGYLEPAPAGLDVVHAHGVDGAQGQGVRVIDLEDGWSVLHEELRHWDIQAPVTGVNFAHFAHGTHVLGLLAAATGNEQGMAGIAPQLARLDLASPWSSFGADRRNVAAAIMVAASFLRRGDILLLEVQTRSLFPIELQPAEREAIQTATAAGITVVEAAGNGGHDLDDQTANGRPVFDPDLDDSGAVLVAAATAAAPHRRLPFSCHGRRINCYGWGESVVTAGSDSSGFPPHDSYRENFGGTSSAAALVAGAAACVQSRARTVHGPGYPPGQLRDMLADADLGTPARDPGQGIGVMPDLAALLDEVLRTPPEA